MSLIITKELVNECRRIGYLKYVACQAVEQLEEKDKEIAKLTSSGELAYHKVGRANVFLIEDLDRYLESKRKSSVNEIREKVRARN